MATVYTFGVCCAETIGDEAGDGAGSWAKTFELGRPNNNEIRKASIGIVRAADI